MNLFRRFTVTLHDDLIDSETSAIIMPKSRVVNTFVVDPGVVPDLMQREVFKEGIQEIFKATLKKWEEQEK